MWNLALSCSRSMYVRLGWAKVRFSLRTRVPVCAAHVVLLFCVMCQAKSTAADLLQQHVAGETLILLYNLLLHICGKAEEDCDRLMHGPVVKVTYQFCVVGGITDKIKGTSCNSALQGRHCSKPSLVDCIQTMRSPFLLQWTTFTGYGVGQQRGCCLVFEWVGWLFWGSECWGVNDFWKFSSTCKQINFCKCRLPEIPNETNDHHSLSRKSTAKMKSNNGIYLRI